MQVTTSAIVLIAASGIAAAQLADVDGSVTTEVWIFNDVGGSALLGSVDIDYVDGFGTASINSIAPGFISPISVALTVVDVDATTRRVDTTWLALFGPFISPGTVLGGEPITNLSFSLGMDTFGPFPGGPLNQFDDPDFVEVIDSTGVMFGGAGISDAGLFTADYAGGFGGRSFFFAPDGAGGLLDLADSGWTTYSSSVTYTIPSPGAAGLLAVGGLLATRRRR
ncbi:MAG: hypothetical protein AAF356_08285 [Planctomycetota bacterium]